MRRTSWLTLALLSACSTGDPLERALPALPPVGGPVVTAAGRLTPENFEKERVPGPASQGLPGDYFMRNDRVRVVVQAPGRAIGPCPFGGNVIDMDRVADPVGDQLGEVSPFLQLGRTLAFDRGEVVRDGSQGGPAVLRFYGHDAKNDFINLVGLGSIVGALIQPAFAADVALGLKAAVTYVLMPGETRLRVTYTMYNPAAKEEKTIWGTLSDTGAGVEVFHPFGGFGEVGFERIAGSSRDPAVGYVAFLGRGLAYGIAPLAAAGEPAPEGSYIAIAGVNVDAYGLRALGDAFGDEGQSLTLPAGGTATRELAILLGPDVGGVTAQVGALRGEPSLPLEGMVADAPGARVAVLALDAPADRQHVTTCTADAGGRFRTALPPGRYRVQAEGEALDRGPAVEVTLPATEVRLSVPKLASVEYTIKDRQGASIPAKVVLVGEPTSTPSRRFRDDNLPRLPHGIAAWTASVGGSSRLGTRHDHPLRVAPGRYRAVVARGPEWSRFEQLLEVPEAGASLDVVLDQVAPTPGYAAADFHQHSFVSPDASADPEDRVAAYLAEGLDFISSAEHDFLFDYAPVIAKLDADRLLASAVGVEVTPWDYGHYIGFPLTVDPLSPNGGALDWGGGEGPGLPPPQIFDGLRTMGAQVVQVNHPRAQPGGFSSFQQGFDRMGLTFDFAGRTFGGDRALMPVSALILGLPEDAPLFAPTFDTLEVYNGFAVTSGGPGGRWDAKVDLIMRDFMNFLSFGFTPTPTGVSDAHNRLADASGLPRTLVRVPGEGATAPGLTEAIVATLTGRGGPRDVVVTNGPFVQLTVDGAGIGATASHPGGPLKLRVTVTTAAWAPVDTIEIFSNDTFEVPVPRSGQAAPLAPALCFTARPAPTPRCMGAIGGARPLSVTSVEAVPGVAASARLEISLDADVDPQLLLDRQRAGARGQDLWLLAVATGDVGLFPVIPELDPSVPVSDLVLTGDLRGRGVPALAFTNAVFVDVDGGGWRGPFAP